MNESVIWSAGCRLPPTLNCTVPQAAGPCATASGGPPAPAQNGSRVPPPAATGQGAPRPTLDTWRLATSAARPRASARPGIVIRGGGGPAGRSPLGGRGGG